MSYANREHQSISEGAARAIRPSGRRLDYGVQGDSEALALIAYLMSCERSQPHVAPLMVVVSDDPDADVAFCSWCCQILTLVARWHYRYALKQRGRLMYRCPGCRRLRTTPLSGRLERLREIVREHGKAAGPDPKVRTRRLTNPA